MDRNVVTRTIYLMYLLLYYNTDGTGAVDGSSATMYKPFLPLFYQAIIMIEEVSHITVRRIQNR